MHIVWTWTNSGWTLQGPYKKGPNIFSVISVVTKIYQVFLGKKTFRQQLSLDFFLLSLPISLSKANQTFNHIKFCSQHFQWEFYPLPDAVFQSRVVRIPEAFCLPLLTTCFTWADQRRDTHTENTEVLFKLRWLLTLTKWARQICTAKPLLYFKKLILPLVALHIPIKHGIISKIPDLSS